MSIVFSNMSQIYSYFMFCAFVGWLLESTYWFKVKMRFINPGFLYGPFVPIYGFGAVIIFLLSAIIGHFFIVFQIIVYTSVAILLEYITSLFLEKLFSLKLWDYSDQKFNLHGRICLKFSLMWVLLITFDIFLFQFYVIKVLGMINIYILNGFILLFTIYLITDVILSFKLYFHFARVVKSAKILAQDSIKEFSPNNIKNNILYQVKSFLIPIRHFPDLLNEVQKNASMFSKSFINELKIKVRNLPEVKTNLKKNNLSFDDDVYFQTTISDIINHEEYKKTKDIYHHKDGKIFDHNMKVAWISYLVGKKLNANLKQLIRGALLHDFFLYDWRKEKPRSGKLHGFEHPKESYENSLKYFSPLSSIEKDIILKHMWPLTIVPPRYLESFIVCAVDKIVATKEYLVNDKKEN